MKPEDLRVGMNYHFFYDRRIDLKTFSNNTMFTISDIAVNENGLVDGIFSNGGFLDRSDLNKIVVFDQGFYCMVDVSDIDNIWNRQLSFNKNFFVEKDYSHTVKQEITKDLVLHITDECYEVLHCVDWKMHKRKPNFVVDRNALLEECIDVFKYLLGILQLWNFNQDEFAKKFFEKCDVVEARYKAELEGKSVR